MAVQNISFSGFELRGIPSKHFVYIINVQWADKNTVIYRRYSQFFNLQCKLLDTFPEEAGANDPERRTLPFLPGKKLVGNFATKTAEKRQIKLEKYLKALVNLPKIAQSELFINFCQTKESDLQALTVKETLKRSTMKCEEITGPIVLPQYTVIVSYTKTQAGELSVKAGTTVCIMEKKKTGWWLAQSSEDDTRGWIPATYLDVPQSEIVENTKFPERGALVEVIRKSLDGWWWCRFKSKEGYLPAAYLCKANSLKARAIASNSTAPPTTKQRVLSKYAPPRPVRPSAKPPRPSKPPTKRNTTFIALSSFTSSMDEGVDLHEGDRVEVITQDVSGWWYVDVNGNKGWAPSTYLKSTS